MLQLREKKLTLPLIIKGLRRIDSPSLDKEGGRGWLDCIFISTLPTPSRISPLSKGEKTRNTLLRMQLSIHHIFARDCLLLAASVIISLCIILKFPKR
jgi:hypothetical protein